MRIDILCKPDSDGRCELVLDIVRKALAHLNVEAEVHYYRDRRKMIDNRVYVTPALMIDDHVRIAGRIPEVREVEALINERPRFVSRLGRVA